jgi:hygromycin-B 7''-O-kinase
LTTEIIFASNKLGEITNAQLQLMLDRLNLGKLISFERTANGAMGQTMFVSSTEGDFVLKGNPLFLGQFIEEKFFIENINKRTGVVVPVPYIIDDSEEIFGWSYSLMPRLQGEHLNSPKIETSINKNEKLEIAELISNTLLEFHSWKVSQFGELEHYNLTVKPFEGIYTEWLYNRIRFWLDDAKKYSDISSEDTLWVETLLESSKDSFDAIHSPTFVMGDFKPGNFLLDFDSKDWKISGVFDFTNAYFGDGLSDLIKMITFYIDNGEQDVARHMLSVYCEPSEPIEGLKQRIRVHMIQQRVLDWGCAKAMGKVTWDDKLRFSNWVEYYTETVASLLD